MGEHDNIAHLSSMITSPFPSPSCRQFAINMELEGSGWGWWGLFLRCETPPPPPYNFRRCTEGNKVTTPLIYNPWGVGG